MAFDINDILEEWLFEPGDANVRRIVGDDGQERIQVRLDLGILQMHVTGRPDGTKPFDYDSLLDYHEHILAQYKAENGSDKGFTIDEKACRSLRAEGAMYYRRFIAQFVLGDYDAVARDTMRNLRMFDFCVSYAAAEHDRDMLEQYRAYVMMMHARAKSRALLEQNKPRKALTTVQQTTKQIRELLEEQHHDAAASVELSILQTLVREIETLIPAHPRKKLYTKLQRAIADEQYEEAAALRDRLEAFDNSPH
ncbi:MAG: UvrB/UvrC motif-containing protein [Phycisphaerae bacterium]|nr:UvrB/UvrC motif-containing protein [Phycisphaerae bacterium]